MGVIYSFISKDNNANKHYIRAYTNSTWKTNIGSGAISVFGI